MTSLSARHSDKVLLDYSAEHLPYDAKLFIACAELSVRIGRAKAQAGLSGSPFTFSLHPRFAASCPVDPTTTQWAVDMAILEASLVHARGLIFFLYDNPARPDDVVASDYVPMWAAAQTPELTEMRRRVNKEVAHPTTQRISGTPPEKAYDSTAFFQLWNVFVDFVKLAPHNRLHEETRAVVRHISPWAGV